MSRKPKPAPKCVIFGQPIPPKGNWAYGNNALPVAEGRSCDGCDERVIPARIRMMQQGGETHG